MKKLWQQIAVQLGKTKFEGTLDGLFFKEFSFRGSGKNAFVLKAWVSTEEGPAIRYRASWEDLKGGEIFYQEKPSDKGWQETTVTEFKIEMLSDQPSLSAKVMTEEGKELSILLIAKIDLQDILGAFFED